MLEPETLFEDGDQRDRWFHDHEDVGRTVAYGSAMGHVLATNLGVFGDSNALKHDAARVMVLEVVRYHREISPSGDIIWEAPPVDTILYTQSFSRAFALARKIPNNITENQMNKIVESQKGRPDLPEKLTADELTVVESAHIAIYAELTAPGQFYEGYAQGQGDAATAFVGVLTGGDLSTPRPHHLTQRGAPGQEDQES